jgi:TonB family protein
VIGVVKSGIARTREMIYDGLVTEGHVEPGNYARSLLRLATMVAVESRTSGNYAVGIFDGGVLEERIRRIRTKRRRAGAVMRFGLMISVAAILLSTVVGAAAMAVPLVSQAGSQDEAQSGASTQASGHVYKVGNGVSAPVPLNMVEAEFPKSALKDKKPIDRIVLIGTIVDAEGIPQNAHLVRSFRADFDAEAVKAVKQYRFKPAMRSGKPVAVSITIEVHFKRY